ncbi:hypothetical protein MOV08_05005 [Streptomyces yunnanensis]|uniref:Uncharacterized protein n=1 Tax=Streptomyces yunnanensis TaxID=156453 RepID=A0ABY8A1A1_9ACTN|nr:hypothetical protein [Streptomyces yunnanensis]WEB38722.1 hypothetical protein MOV08_05005 [Streptomyces yunnanensis]
MTDRHHRPRAARADGERHPTAGRTVGLGGSSSTAALVVALVLHLAFQHGRRRAEGASAAA